MHFGFSYIGLMFLIMLIVPNLFWTKNQPKDYENMYIMKAKSCCYLRELAKF